MSKKTIPLPQEVIASAEYENMVNLLAVYSEASNQLKRIETDANGELLEILDDKKKEYASLQEALTKSEAALELIALSHPEWFEARNSIKTPYGVVKFRSSTVLEIANEEASIILVENESKTTEGKFDAGLYIKTKQTLNKEALEKLDDATLTRLRIKRVPKRNFSVEAATVEMGKAVKEAVEEEAK